jgi:hypothetical protein
VSVGGGVVMMAVAILAVVLHWMPLHVPLIAALAVGRTIWNVLRMKQVETDGRSLFVSTMSRTMSLPLTLVEPVDAGGLLPGGTVTVVSGRSLPSGRRSSSGR